MKRENSFTAEELDLVKTISDQHKLILTLYYVEKLPIHEIRYVMGMPIGTIEYILRHFTKRVLQKIEENKGIIT